MPDLLSIAPLTETVEVRGAKVQVRGVSAQGVVGLLTRFPALNKMWATGKWDNNQLLALSDDILVAILVAGVTNLDEKNAANLALDEKAEILSVILRVTMPRGPVPFMATLTAMLGAVGGGAALPKGQVTN
jgi:hypothetical protein